MNLLIAAGESVSDPEALPAGISSLLGAASEIHVMTPSFVSRLQWLTGEYDHARHVADERLDTILAQPENVEDSENAEVSSSRGDELPMTAFRDARRTFRPDHILVAYRKSQRRAWQEKNLIDRLVDDFDIPVTVFEVS